MYIFAHSIRLQQNDDISSHIFLYIYIYIIPCFLTSIVSAIGEGPEQHAAVIATDHLQSTESHWPVCCSCQTVQFRDHEDHWQICSGLCTACSFCCQHSEHQSLQWFILVCLSHFKRLWRQSIPCVFEFLYMFSVACGCVCSNAQWTVVCICLYERPVCCLLCEALLRNFKLHHHFPSLRSLLKLFISWVPQG